MAPALNGARQVSPAFRAAYTKFRARLPGDQLQNFEKTTYEQLCQELIRIQYEQEKLKTMMDLSRIQSCLEALTQFGKVVEVFLNVSEVVAFVWGPIKFLLMTASTTADSFETLLDAYQQIGEVLPMLEAYEDLFNRSPHMLNALELMYIDILEFHRHALRFFSGKLWKKFFRSMWKDFGTKFNGILSNLRRHKELVESQAAVEHMQQYQKDRNQFQRYEQDIRDMNAKLEVMIKDERDKKFTALREWFGVGAQMTSDHELILQVRDKYPATGRWILEHEVIKVWMFADIPVSPMIWMTGIPGAGKTVLASVIIEELLRERKSENPPVVSYFYCNYNGNNEAVTVLKGILHQLLDQYPDLMPHCLARKATSGEPSLRSFTNARRLFEDFCLSVPKQYIIIDGLDECDLRERKQLLELFVQMMGQCDAEDPGCFRVLFVSQDYADIKRSLHSSAEARIAPKIISLSSSDNEKDIRVYMNDLMGQIKMKHGLKDEQAEYLQHLTIHRAQGMFLYAKLVVLNLLQQPTRQQLLEEVNSRGIPKDLAQAYERIVTRIKRNAPQAEWEIAKKLLGWMVCAKRQLTWKEIQVVLSINLDDQTIEYDNRRLRTHIHDICGSLVHLSGDRVQLVHGTAKLYVRCTKEIHEASVECELANLCLQYLTFECFGKDEEVDMKNLRQFTLEGHLGFQDYAVAKWFYHVNSFVALGEDFLREGVDVQQRLDGILMALDEFMTRYDDEDWEAGIIDQCKDTCKVFKGYPFYDHLVALTSHIYTFQKKGFEARHVVSIRSLAKALERNRKLLEELPKDAKTAEHELRAFRQFYDYERRFKCPKISCIYFFEGFKDAKSRKRHVNVHDRPYQCEAIDCIGAEYGFANSKDLEKHMRSFHPEMSDLANSFKSTEVPRAKAVHVCGICGKTFTRKFHKIDHEKSHRGERPNQCPECGKAFTRVWDMKRHRKLHDRPIR
ncbi:C2H2 domain-containing protein [Lojkania enalia]|uniref:C2H2 domain-containing protein n=1 Tax=Lojkania enalia TaxID=147567 RepID=A0A9P4N0A7_9PLEO|nr:C2H2 domain-containing protein [Didymosphaeria enalia]